MIYLFIKHDRLSYQVLNKNGVVKMKAHWERENPSFAETRKSIPTLIVQKPDKKIFSKSYLQPSKSFIHSSWNDKYILAINNQKYVMSRTGPWRKNWEVRLNKSSYKYLSEFWSEQSTILKDNNPILKINGNIISLKKPLLETVDFLIGMSIYFTLEDPWQISEVNL